MARWRSEMHRIAIAFFRDTDVLVGHAAVAQQEKNSANTLYDAKRFIGKRFTEDELQKESSRYQFKV